MFALSQSLVQYLIVILAIQLAMLTSAFAASSESFQNAPLIFDVRINLPLEPNEPIYHDFYINAGPDAGFKKGMFITVMRPVPVHDPVQNKQQGTLNVNVARLQIIHVERGLTVARLHSEFGDDERPTLEFESVMIGDRIDPNSLTMEAPSLKKKARAAGVKLKAKIEAKNEESTRSDSSQKAPTEQIPVPQPPVKLPPLTPGQSTSVEPAIPLLAGWN